MTKMNVESALTVSGTARFVIVLIYTESVTKPGPEV